MKLVIAALERALGTRTCFVDDVYGLADIAVGCMLGYLDLRLPEFDWRPRAPGLAKFSERIFRRPAFEATMPAPQPIDEVQ